MGLNDPSLYARVAEVLLGADEIGCLVVSVMPGSERQGPEQIEALLPTLVRADKPVVYTIMGGESPIPPANRLRILDAGLPLFRSPERAMAAVKESHRVRAEGAVRRTTRSAPAQPSVVRSRAARAHSTSTARRRFCRRRGCEPRAARS